MADATVLRGRVLSFSGDPSAHDDEAVSYWEKGTIVIEDGLITAVGEVGDVVIPTGSSNIDYEDDLILPGFIDGHVHYPQIGVIGSYGTKLLDWLNTYTFPEESKFLDQTKAEETAQFFLSQSVKNGYTTSAVFCTTHPQSVDAYFRAADRLGLRSIAGKVLMDRNAPDTLLDTAQTGYDQSKALIEKWHHHGRNHYCVTPRFAPTSSPEQLELAGTLYKEFEGVYVQSHVAENEAECAWVEELFPDAASYLDVYNRFGLLGERTLYGHAIHFSDVDMKMAAASGAGIIHCPTSNLFLGSGLFEYDKMRDAGVKVALGTDIGGGTSLSPFATAKAAYDIAQLRGTSISPLEAFYLLTLGGARALRLDDKIGRIVPGYEADLTVIDLNSTDIIRHRMRSASNLNDALFAQIILGDDRAIRAVYANGLPIFQSNQP